MLELGEQNKNKKNTMPTNVDKFFAYEHLPDHLQKISKLCADLQKAMESNLPDCAEKSAGMRKLLEAKDCFLTLPSLKARDSWFNEST